MRRTLGLEEEFAILTVSRLEPRKGVDTLIRAASMSRVRPALLIVGDSAGYSGDDDYANDLQDLAEELQVDARFLGSREGCPRTYCMPRMYSRSPPAGRHSDSYWPRASASGLPVVKARDVGSCSEVVVAGATGVLLESDAVSGFAATFDRLADDPALRSRMGTAGRRHARRQVRLRACRWRAAVTPYLGLIHRR